VYGAQTGTANNRISSELGQPVKESRRDTDSYKKKKNDINKQQIIKT